MPVSPIPGDKTYYLGYIVERRAKRASRLNPDDEEVKKELKVRETCRDLENETMSAYLASDHMDVYVATSMRTP